MRQCGIATLALTPENWRNTWRVALGANHHYNEHWMARAGLAYNVDPVPEGLRTARIFAHSWRRMVSPTGR